MNVGVLKLRFRLEGNNSLKDKRRIVKPIINKIKDRFEVSAAEVENNDERQLAVIGISVVSNDKVMIDRVLNAVISFVDQSCFGVELIRHEMEIITF
jgi:uncharacterized protein YlxP (DUF503 family)